MMVDYKLGMDQIVWDTGVVMHHRYAIYGKPEIASLNYYNFYQSSCPEN